MNDELAERSDPCTWTKTVDTSPASQRNRPARARRERRVEMVVAWA